MSPRVRYAWLGIMTSVVIILILRTKFATSNSPTDVAEQTQTVQINPDDVTHPKSRVRTKKTPAKIRGSDNNTTVSEGVNFVDSTIMPPSVPVSGYIVDVFSNWKDIPPDYFADGIAVTGGAITLIDSTKTSAPRSGILESPALPLRQPALAAPAAPSPSIPANSEVSLQISLSEDGEKWSPWLRVNRYSPPDGKRVSPPMQASLANPELQSVDTKTSGALEGPAIRYRLSLATSGGQSPAVSDVRIWKREAN